MYLLQATLLACFTSYTCVSSVIGFSPRSEKSTNVMSRDMKSTRNSIALAHLHHVPEVAILIGKYRGGVLETGSRYTHIAGGHRHVLGAGRREHSG